MLRVTERTVRHWETGATRVPFAAYKLLRVLRGFHLPGDAWTGWMLVRDRLVTPEGHAFRPDDFAWLALTVAQARAFRRLYDAQRAAGDRSEARPQARPSAGLGGGTAEHAARHSGTLPATPSPAGSILGLVYFSTSVGQKGGNGVIPRAPGPSGSDETPAGAGGALVAETPLPPAGASIDAESQSCGGLPAAALPGRHQQVSEVQP